MTKHSQPLTVTVVAPHPLSWGCMMLAFWIAIPV